MNIGRLILPVVALSVGSAFALDTGISSEFWDTTKYANAQPSSSAGTLATGFDSGSVVGEASALTLQEWFDSVLGSRDEGVMDTEFTSFLPGFFLLIR